MACSVHDIALAFGQLAGPDGCSSGAPAAGMTGRPLRVGWKMGPASDRSASRRARDFALDMTGLPINMQVVGARHAEATILHVAGLLESARPVRGLRPAL